MKTISLFVVLALALIASGCKSTTSSSASGTKPAATAKPAAIVTPDLSLAAKVVSVNDAGHFVVLSFPAGKLPETQRTLSLYRQGLKVAEVKIGTDKNENLIVADITSGDPRVGDVVRVD